VSGAVSGERTRRCLVIGSPIGHSRSPLIHRLFAEQFAIALRYEKREVAPGALRAALTAFVDERIVGVNVTVPLKEEACALADERSDQARLAGAANVLSLDPTGRVRADNTDGTGFLEDLAAHHIAVSGRRILLLGAGGAARGVVPALLGQRAEALVIANRSRDKAEVLVGAFSGLGPVSASPLEAVFSEPFDLVVNATSLGVTGTGGFPLPLSRSALGPATACYDLVYGSGETPFLRWAREQGVARRVDGLGMLVEQAAAAFEIWHGRRPATAPVLEYLRRRV
jgi:shikimate dehydrogenase